MFGRGAAGLVAGLLLAGCGSPSPRVERDVGRDRFAGEAIALNRPASNAAVSVQKECTACHANQHDYVLGRGALASVKCAGCHGQVHGAMQALYDGTAYGDVARADPMFAEHVACAECHTPATLKAAKGDQIAAIDRACVSCHGVKFAGMLSRWSTGLAWRQRLTTGYVSTAAVDRRLSRKNGGMVHVRAAQEAVALIAAGVAVHNVRGSDALLRAALDSVAVAYKEAGLPVPARPDLGPDPAVASCAGCHYGIEAARDSTSGKLFEHRAHVMQGDLACTECHSAADYIVPGKHEVDRRHGRTMVTAESCESCHHQPRSTTACVTCHTGDLHLGRAIPVVLPLKLRPEGSPTSRSVAFEHVDHPNVECASCHTSRAAVTKTVACANCHEPHHKEGGRCAACHGSDVKSRHKAADHLSCSRCHAAQTVALLVPDRSFCLTCHADRAEHKPARECSTCHMQSTPTELRRRLAQPATATPKED